MLILAVVLSHVFNTYGIGLGWPYYEIGELNPAITVLGLLLVGIGVGFAMGLFFMIAGYFTPRAYDRKGFWRFLGDRLKRLGVPWLIYVALINPLIYYLVDVHGTECHGGFYNCLYQGTFWQYLKEFPAALGNFADGPIWFLEALLIFSIFYALWRLVASKMQFPAPAEPDQPRPVPGNRTIILFALAISLSTFVARFWFDAFVKYEPFNLEFARFPQYIALFVAGVWAYRNGWLFTFSDRQARPWRWVALVCVLTLPVLTVAFGALTETPDERAVGGVNWLSLTYSLWEGFLAVSMTLLTLVLFRRHFNRQNRLAKVLSDTSFLVYVIHPAIIILVALALSSLQMNLSFKFLIVAPIVISLCYLVAYALLKAPLVKRVFG